MATVEKTERRDQQDRPGDMTVLAAEEMAALLQEAEKRGLMGAKDRQMGGRFPTALVEAAQAATGITEPTDLLTYALMKVAFEDNYGLKLFTRAGTVPPGTFGEY